MADEIRNQNVIRVTREEGFWRAAIGPDDRTGLFANGPTPERAIEGLHYVIGFFGWPFDPSYRPRTPPTFHEA